ncbi:endolytic transglycosylase MltG [Mycetocola sp. 2940]|uniref:endolytic transglycosylase MltG n=1 Tax=Mycetocola sp. 2940 TaxID=3156452 RepID=UPI003394C72B
MTGQTPRDDAFDAIFRPDGSEPPAPAAPDAAAPMSRREAREQAARASAAAPVASDEPPREFPEPAEPPAGRTGRRAADSEYPPREKRGKRKKTGLIAAIVVLVLFAGIGGGGLYVWNTFEPQIREVMGWKEPVDYVGKGDGEVKVAIASGDDGSDIARTLKNSGVTKTTEAFYELLLTQSSEPVFHPGVYLLAKKMSAQAALDALLDPANKIERTVLLREGITGAEILTELSAGTEIPVEEFQAAVADPTIYGVQSGVPSIEGWLFPALYTFDPDLTAQQIIQVLVDRTIQSLDNAGVPEADRERILTIASIIQREARLEEDFYKVSRVIQNRLDTNMNLEMDSTAQYAEVTEPGSVWSTKEALESDNPWNTYTRPGLPIGPIANPGDTAIAAAMAPAEGTWLFFVTVNLDTGETVFTNTVAEHGAAVQQLKAWCTANPGKGC